MPQVELRDEDGTLSLEPLELDHEIRRGRVPCTAEIRYGPWTGAEFARVDTLPALAEAVDAPEARAAAHLERKPFPWATAALAVTLIAAFIGQLALGDTKSLGGAVGFEPTILNGAWWSPWTAPFLHAGIGHLLGNLPVLLYCGFRVERALGPGGLWQALIGSILGAALLIVPFSELPVVGSSILAYGAWGAQFGVGLRLGEVIPSKLRGAYGWGTFVFFPFLLVSSFSAPHVSVLGHVGGYLGGLVAALVVRSEVMAPRRAVTAVRLRVLATGVGVLAALSGLAVGLATSPSLLCPSTRVVGLPEQGLELPVCWRMPDFPTRVGGHSAWKVSPDSDSAVFASFAELQQPERLDPEWLRARWERALGGAATVAETPALREGWKAWTFTGASGTVLEQVRVEGLHVYQVGWYSKRDLSPARRAFYESLLRNVRVTEPAELKTRREQWSKLQASPERTYQYASALEEAGRYDEAMALYVPLVKRSDGWEWEATRARFRVCAYHPGMPTCGGGWREEWLKKAPAEDVWILLPAVRWLAAEGRCADAQNQARRLAEVSGVDTDAVKEALGSCDERK